MVRYADEIVDTFHGYDKKYLLQKFKEDTFDAIERQISLNPILFSFQKVVNEYNIPDDLIDAFFKSMESDLYQTFYDDEGYKEYIYGSAEVVGLMCMRVFAEGDDKLYEQLKEPAKALGAAFQKVNFLRDMNSDHKDRGRVYFPGIDFNNFGDQAKKRIEKEVAEDFAAAYRGIMELPDGAQEGVMLAYRYYMDLFASIRLASADKLKESRIRVPDSKKMLMLLSTLISRFLGYRPSHA
jgi:phytoene/squalene synthetase